MVGHEVELLVRPLTTHGDASAAAQDVEMRAAQALEDALTASSNQNVWKTIDELTVRLEATKSDLEDSKTNLEELKKENEALTATTSQMAVNEKDGGVTQYRGSQREREMLLDGPLVHIRTLLLLQMRLLLPSNVIMNVKRVGHFTSVRGMCRYKRLRCTHRAPWIKRSHSPTERVSELISVREKGCGKGKLVLVLG